MSDPFEKAPEFLAAFNNILSNGFFEQVEFQAGMAMMEGEVPNCHIRAHGCVPSEKKYSSVGCGALIDPASIVSSCKELSKKQKVKQVLVTVKTENWPLWDNSGNNVIGSKGTRTEMFIFIRFDI